jgi:GNAT superfamily N-acetyltransferase
MLTEITNPKQPVMKVNIAKSDEDILKCWNVLFELRPHLKRDYYLATIKEMFTEGYQLAYIQEDDQAAAAIGFRYLQYLYNGKQIYIDDISTLPKYRGKGYGGELIEFVFRYAKEKGYRTVTLDSGYQRFSAHRLYLNKGFTLNSHHFSKTID